MERTLKGSHKKEQKKPVFRALFALLCITGTALFVEVKDQFECLFDPSMISFPSPAWTQTANIAFAGEIVDPGKVIFPEIRFEKIRHPRKSKATAITAVKQKRKHTPPKVLARVPQPLLEERIQPEKTISDQEKMQLVYYSLRRGYELALNSQPNLDNQIVKNTETDIAKVLGEWNEKPIHLTQASDVIVLRSIAEDKEARIRPEKKQKRTGAKKNKHRAVHAKRQATAIDTTAPASGQDQQEPEDKQPEKSTERSTELPSTQAINDQWIAKQEKTLDGEQGAANKGKNTMDIQAGQSPAARTDVISQDEEPPDTEPPQELTREKIISILMNTGPPKAAPAKKISRVNARSMPKVLQIAQQTPPRNESSQPSPGQQEGDMGSLFHGYPPVDNQENTDQEATACGSGSNELILQNGIEAFRWIRPYGDINTETLSQEGFENKDAPGWHQLNEKEVLPEIFFGQLNVQDVPVVSEGLLTQIEGCLNRKIQKNAGFVFGIVPEGVRVEYTGRTEPAIYISERDKDGALLHRYFILLNVEPGAQFVYTRQGLDGDVGSVAVPVLESRVTYVDLSNPVEISLRGVVIEADSASNKPLKDVSVSMAGPARQTAATTDRNGYFRLSRAISYGRYPVYVESECQDGIRHRYRIPSGKVNEDAMLFCFPEKQIQGLIGPLEGGVSTESALIIAALPSVFSLHPEEPVFPSIQTLLEQPTLIPETYSLSEGDTLQINTPLSPKSPRFLGVQIPAGPVLSSLDDRTQKRVWSEMVFASPRVVNVIGPE